MYSIAGARPLGAPRQGVLAGSSACEHAACADGNMKELNEFCLQVERQKSVRWSTSGGHNVSDTGL
jgi:hypothetical protein